MCPGAPAGRGTAGRRPGSGRRGCLWNCWGGGGGGAAGPSGAEGRLRRGGACAAVARGLCAPQSARLPTCAVTIHVQDTAHEVGHASPRRGDGMLQVHGGWRGGELLQPVAQQRQGQRWPGQARHSLTLKPAANSRDRKVAWFSRLLWAGGRAGCEGRARCAARAVIPAVISRHDGSPAPPRLFWWPRCTQLKALRLPSSGQFSLSAYRPGYFTSYLRGRSGSREWSARHWMLPQIGASAPSLPRALPRADQHAAAAPLFQRGLRRPGAASMARGAWINAPPRTHFLRALMTLAAM